MKTEIEKAFLRREQWQRLVALDDMDRGGLACYLWGFLTQAEKTKRKLSAGEILDTIAARIEQLHGAPAHKEVA